MHCQRSGNKIVIIFTILLVVFKLPALAQYYPAPKPIAPDMEAGLISRLEHSRFDLEKIPLLLDLCNLNFNKPLKRVADMNRAMIFVRKASKLSIKLHNRSGFNDAQFFIADIFTERDDMKSAEDILPLVNDTTRINLLLDLSFKYERRLAAKKEDDYKKALLFAQQARVLSVKYHQPEKEILALKDIAVVHGDQENKAAEDELQEVIKRYNAIGYRNLHYTYFALAILDYQRGKPDKALYYSLQAMKSMKMTGDSTAAGDFYICYSTICINNDEFQKAIDYASMAIDRYKIHRGAFNLSDDIWIFGKIPTALRKLKRYREALLYIQSVIKKYPPQNDSQKIDYDSIVGNIYRDMKDYDKAEGYFVQMLELSKKQGIADFHLYRDIGQLYVESHHYARARPYLYKVLEFPESEKSSAVARHLEYMLFLADSATGRYLSAIKHLNKNHALNEASVREAKDKEVQKLSIQFETAKKESEIKIKDQNIALLKENANLEEGRLHQATLIKNITIGATLFLIAIIALVYKQYRNKRQNNLIITQANNQLQHLLQEKEWLLKEVHHRVKNNLHTVISLLQAQTAYLEDDALNAVANSQNRIYAMSLIHQKLYQSEDIKTIDMAVYVPELVQYLKDSFDISNQIHFRLKIDPICLGVSHAIPLGLIINEAVTNSIKYAFPGKSTGEISISLVAYGDQIKLEIADNGIGMDLSLIEKEQNSLGLDLMKGLSKDIKADISFNTYHGTTITVLFKPEELHNTDDFLARQDKLEI